MKYFSIFVAFIILLLPGCKKASDSSSTNNDEISFTCNGKNYSFKTLDGANGVNVYKGYYDTPIIQINLATEFSGTLFYQKTGCAYVLPKNSNITLNPGCVLLDHNSFSVAVPIDSMKVPLYFSGSLNLITSSCQTTTGNFLGLSVTSQNCDVNGTFDLVLKNKNNETIIITNGVVKVHHAFMKFL